MDVVKSSVVGCLATHAATAGEGLGLMSSERTFASRMIIRQIPGLGACRHVVVAQIRAPQTLRTAGVWPLPDSALPATEGLERSAKSPSPPLPSTVRGGQL